MSKCGNCETTGVVGLTCDRCTINDLEGRLKSCQADNVTKEADITQFEVHLGVERDMVRGLEVKLAEQKNLHAGLSAAYKSRGDELNRSHMQCMELSKMLAEQQESNLTLNEAKCQAEALLVDVEAQLAGQTTLSQYARHDEGCSAPFGYECKCGLDKLLPVPSKLSPATFLNDCTYQVAGHGTMCNNLNSVHYKEPCDKRCTEAEKEVGE